MSRKWQRVKQWDSEHLTGWLRPIRVVLAAFSSIPLAVSLLSFVALYAVLASVPIGLLALAPTYIIHAITLVLAVVVGAGLPALGVRTLLLGAGRGLRFTASTGVLLALSVVSVWLWQRFAWPRLHYDATTGTGLMLFREFVEANGSTTLRRLPMLEMTELEFYAWWPMRLALLMFVTNMVVATVRRIEFDTKHIGVLSVHTGIVMIALGSVFYSRFKLEGDTLLIASPPRSAEPGPLQGAFYDNIEVVLYAAQHPGWNGQPQWEQRLIKRLPRYNPYSLAASDADPDDLLSNLQRPARSGDPGRELSIDIPAGAGRFVDADLSFRVVGYAPYAEVREDWVSRSPAPGAEPVPLRVVELEAEVPASGQREAQSTRFHFSLKPTQPAGRVSSSPVLGIEYSIGMADERFELLSTPLAPDTQHALIVEIPLEDGQVYTAVLAAEPLERFELDGTGYSVGIKVLHPTPPFPIITEGYRGAISSLAVVEITTPDGQTYDRWVYSRFPEIDQDMLPGVGSDGRPSRRDADTDSIRVSYIDASKLNVWFDEQPDGNLRAIVRQRGGKVAAVDSVTDGQLADILPNDDGATVNLSVVARWAHAERIEMPAPVPERERDKQFIGTHDRAMMAVEIASMSPEGTARWTRTVWLGFTKYMGVGMGTERDITLPDGRSLSLAFGRRQHQFPGFAIALAEFEMIAYDHRGAPRDYQSIVRVEPSAPPGRELAFEAYTHVTRLNAPLTAPFRWDESATLMSNVFGRLASGISPKQFKLSQAGWDRDGWEQSQRLVDEGTLDKPHAQFTILGVGNSPGIHIIALGAVFMALGIPWAFYLKPWLLRRERDRIKAAAVRSVKASAAPRVFDQPVPVEVGS